MKMRGNKIEVIEKKFMKNILPSIALILVLVSCNSGDTAKAGSDTANTNAPSSIKDTGTQHPNGVTSDGVISTDTAGFGVKASSDSANKKEKKQ